MPEYSAAACVPKNRFSILRDGTATATSSNGTSMFKQFDSFQSPCPTTSRHSVIPDRNIRRHQAESSLQILLGPVAFAEVQPPFQKCRAEQRRCDYQPAIARRIGPSKRRLFCDGAFLSLAKQERFKRWGFLTQRVRPNGAIYLVATPSWAVIPPRNITRTRSCWTARLNQVTFAPQAADLGCCGRCKCHVGLQSVSSANSGSLLGRTHRLLSLLSSPYFLRCPWKCSHKVHRSTLALPLSRAFSPTLFEGCQSGGDRDRRLRPRPRARFPEA